MLDADAYWIDHSITRYARTLAKFGLLTTLGEEPYAAYTITEHGREVLAALEGSDGR